MIATQAPAKTASGETCAYSSAMATGTATSSQSSEGLSFMQSP